MNKRVFCIFLTLLMLLGAVNASAATSFMPTRDFEGVTYEARSSNDITTMLLIGYDHIDNGELDIVPENYIKGGQCDFLLLLVFDHENEQIRQLQFNRDTLTPVRYYSKEGKYYGVRDLQICLAHAYGDTQELNNQNTIWTVENLLGIGDEKDGAQIDYYISMDISGIARLNDLLGGVTVPIEHDFSYYDTSMVQGTTMTLKGRQAEYYCRHRYYIGDSSNLCRMQRQRTYMGAATKLLRQKVTADPNFAYELLNGLGIIFDTTRNVDAGFGFTTTDSKGTPVTDTPDHYLMTNHSLDGLVALLARVLNYEVVSPEVLAGKSEVGSSGFMEHILEENVGLKWSLDALYRPLN